VILNLFQAAARLKVGVLRRGHTEDHLKGSFRNECVSKHEMIESKSELNCVIADKCKLFNSYKVNGRSVFNELQAFSQFSVEYLINRHVVHSQNQSVKIKQSCYVTSCRHQGGEKIELVLILDLGSRWV
jgi:hypothetical protein